MKKYKNALIFGGIAIAAFLAYWFLGRRKNPAIAGSPKKVTEDELQKLRDIFATGNPYKNNVLTVDMRTATPENSLINYEGGGEVSPPWHPNAGEPRIEVQNKEAFDNIVYSEIRTILNSPTTVQRVDDNRFNLATGLSKFPPEYIATLAAAVASSARSGIAGRYYYDNLNVISDGNQGYFDVTVKGG